MRRLIIVFGILLIISGLLIIYDSASWSGHLFMQHVRTNGSVIQSNVISALFLLSIGIIVTTLGKALVSRKRKYNEKINLEKDKKIEKLEDRIARLEKEKEEEKKD